MKQSKDRSVLGEAWKLYKMGGITPALASMLGSSTAQQMAFIRSIARGQRKVSVLDKRLSELVSVVFDLETTGFHPQQGDEIIAIGGVALRGGEMEGETFYRLVNPGRCIPPHITELTGITNEMAEEGSELVDGLHDFMDFIRNKVLIAHGGGHDKRFLNFALRRTSRTDLTHRMVDTMMIAKWLEPNEVQFGLDEVLKRHNIEVSGRHHALQDSLMTAKLYASFLKQIHERQVTTLGDLYAYLSRR